MSALKPGHRLDRRFTLLRPLGRGGSAEVWLVRDNDLEEDVAAKIVPAISEERLRLLRRECRQARRLIHPNIVRVFDFHRGTDVGFVTMDAVEGEALSRRRGAPLDEILRLVLPIADALDHAHRRGVIHRDVKAGNVICDAAGMPHLLDFGIAGLLESADDPDAIRGGGSLSGSSPQQRAGGEPSASDDIYSFGVMLYDLITGHAPGAGDAEERRTGSTMPEPLRSLIERMLAPATADRPASMAQVKAELEALPASTKREVGSATEVTPIRLTPPPRVERRDPVNPQPFAVPKTKPVKRPAGGRGFGRWFVGLVVVGLLAVVLLVVLPQFAERRANPLPARASDLEAGTAGTEVESVDRPSESPTPTAGERRAADDALGRVMELQKKLEAQAVRRWGGDAYSDAIESVARGDQELTGRDFVAAASSYRAASRQLEALEDSIPRLLSETLADGRASLLAGDSERAVEAFGLAAAIGGTNAEAATGLLRAERFDEVALLLVSAREHEQGGDFPRAEREYLRAVALDSASAEAREGLTRVRAGLTGDLFDRAMSLGLAAIDDGDYANAREALVRANSFRPGAAEVADAFTRLSNAERAVALAEHRRVAQEFESAESWNNAVTQYEQALALDATVRFARDGLERAQHRADLARRIDYHLAHPDRLSSDEVLEEVESLLDEANEVVSAGPDHRERVLRLTRVVEAAAQPVSVLLESDDLTEVTIHKVGRLGTFLQHEIRLRPGTYTVVGSRKGYRDVRYRLVVKGNERPTLTVRCEEEV